MLLYPYYMREEAILKESFDDIRQDFTELLYIIASDQEYLSKFVSSLKKNKKHILPASLEWIEKMSTSCKKELNQYHEELLLLRKKAQGKNHSLPLLSQLIQAKKGYFDLLRTQQNVFASLITATDWQSPSYAHSLHSRAGVQTGKIIGTINDYKRDQHLNEKEFENAYLSEYIDSRFKFLIKVYATGSGMAAFTTILNFLMMEGKIKGKILVGKSSYFEYKELIIRSFPDCTIVIDESQTENIIETIQKEKPDAIFLDSLCNSTSLALPNLQKIITYLTHQYQKEIYVVIDNSCLSVFYQLMKAVVGKRGKVTLLCFESLNKYVQFGLDRTTGGMITAYGKDVGKLYEYRDHSGTNISDSSVYMIPRPNRDLLEKRLLRHQRNTFFLASFLDGYIKIVYPGLPSHPSFSWAKNLPFQGSFFAISFKKKSIPLYKKFIGTILKMARKKDIDIVAGTSFGLCTTRVYITSLRADFNEPFVRVSVGTENRCELEKLKNLFCEAIATF